MNVRELIRELEKIEDKELPVMIDQLDVDYEITRKPITDIRTSIYCKSSKTEMTFLKCIMLESNY